MLCSFLLSLALAQAPAGQADQVRSVSIAAPTTATSSTATSSTAPPLIRTTYAEKLKVRGLPNGGRISESLYRGAQPSTEGMEQLRSLGITTIVDLRGEDSQKSEWERQQAETLGIHFVKIPVSGWAAPSNQQVLQFLALFRNNPKEKVFIHCRFGEDRTGVFVAAYRMAFDRWSAEQAINEMYFFGFNGLWHSSMKSFVRSFPTQLKTESIFADYRSQGEQTVTKCDQSAGAAECAN
jgi:tyrosine-protein phosphatase SIW14